MKILVINNDGGGFADYIDIPARHDGPGTLRPPDGPGKADNYLIRVNRQPAARDQVLVEGDRVSITPTKIEGAVG